jgi:hypothetical protein
VRCAAEGDGPWVDHPLCAAGSAVADPNGVTGPRSIRRQNGEGVDALRIYASALSLSYAACGRPFVSSESPADLRGVPRLTVACIGEAGNVPNPCEQLVALCAVASDGLTPSRAFSCCREWPHAASGCSRRLRP